MEILDKVKSYIGITDTSKDGLLNALIEDAKIFILSYCNLESFDSKLDSTAAKMVLQDYTKLTAQGLASQSYSGVSESYINGYSDDILKTLNSNRKVKFL